MEVPAHSRIVNLQCKHKPGAHHNGSTSGAMHYLRAFSSTSENVIWDLSLNQLAAPDGYRLSVFYFGPEEGMVWNDPEWMGASEFINSKNNFMVLANEPGIDLPQTQCFACTDFMYMKGMDAKQATEAGIEYLVRKVKGRGSVIVIDRDGNCSSGVTTKRMIHGWIEKGGEPCCRF